MREIYSFLDQYLPTLTDPIIVEIGAADAGDTSLIIPYLRGEWTYYAFEPDPRNVDVFCKVIKNPRVILCQTALGSSIGKTTLHMSGGKAHSGGPEHVWSSSIRRPKEHLKVSPWCTFENTCEVDVTTIDAYFRDKDLDYIDFIWCDAQGSEIDILKGATNTLPKIKYLYMEYSNLEMYEGQATYDGLLAQLGDRFEVVHKYEAYPEGDVLVRNKNYV